MGREWPDTPAAATVGLEYEAGRITFDHSDGPSLPPELQILLPHEGLELKIMEIGGGHGGHLRRMPRAQRLDGLVICYDAKDRSSFKQAAHYLMIHGTERHLAEGGVAAASPTDSATAAAGLATILIGAKADELEDRPISAEEADEFAAATGIRHSSVACARTRQGVDEALFALAIALLEAEEEALAERELAGKEAVSGEVWSLPTNLANLAMTSPQAERPLEPREICVKGKAFEAPRLVEVLDESGIPYATKPLATCLERGLLHRALHIWLVDPRTGGLLLRRYWRAAPKLASLWGPSFAGEVLCYGGGQGTCLGLLPAETALEAAGRTLREQAGVEDLSLELWFSMRSRSNYAQELIDVFVASFPHTTLPSLQLRRGEEIEWVHFLDVFGGQKKHGDLFHVDETYSASMIQKMRARILHYDAEVSHAKNLPNKWKSGFAQQQGWNDEARSFAQQTRLQH